MALQVDRVANLTSKYFGRPSTHHLPLPQPEPISQSEDDTPTENCITSSVEHDLSGSNPSLSIPYAFQQILEHDKPFLMNMASYAIDEVIQLLQRNEPLWVKSASDAREVLQLQAYQMSFPNSHQPNSGTRTEASRDSSIVMMSGRMLVDAFMNSVRITLKGKEFFSSSFQSIQIRCVCRTSGCNFSLQLFRMQLLSMSLLSARLEVLLDQ